MIALSTKGLAMITTLKSYLVKSVAISLLLLNYSVANASLILEWNSNSASSNTPATGASAKATLDFFDDGGLVRIDMLIRNTTGELASFGSGATTSKLTGIGFDLITPNGGLFAANFSGGTYFDTMIANASLPPFGTLDLGLADNTNFVGGNANGALPEGTEDTLSMKIGFNGLSALDVENAFKAGFNDGSLDYVARFVQVNAGAGSDKLNGGECCGEPENPQEVPEPSTVMLLSLGLMGLLLRRKS